MFYRRIVSQCNSRDPSANRAMSPRDNDGFRVPSAVPKSGTWTNNQVCILGLLTNIIPHSCVPFQFAGLRPVLLTKYNRTEGCSI